MLFVDLARAQHRDLEYRNDPLNDENLLKELADRLDLEGKLEEFLAPCELSMLIERLVQFETVCDDVMKVDEPSYIPEYGEAVERLAEAMRVGHSAPLAAPERSDIVPEA